MYILQMVYSCSMAGCSAKAKQGRDVDSSVFLHQLPKQSTLRNKWLGFIRQTRADFEGKEEHVRICSKHFRSSDYDNLVKMNICLQSGTTCRYIHILHCRLIIIFYVSLIPWALHKSHQFITTLFGFDRPSLIEGAIPSIPSSPLTQSLIRHAPPATSVVKRRRRMEMRLQQETVNGALRDCECTAFIYLQTTHVGCYIV